MIVTLTTASGVRISGPVSVAIHEGTATVFVGNIIASEYSGCSSAEDATNMMLEDYGVSDEDITHA